MNAATDGQRDWARRQDAAQPREYGDSAGKLSPAQRDEIRQRLADGESIRRLAEEFGVHTNTIRQYRP